MLTYNNYLKVPELCRLQNLLSDPPHHDEMLFIVIHQTYELWFKLMIHEIEHSIRCIKNKEILNAHHFLKRVGEIMKVLVNQIHILETMRPVDFLEFRERITPASGFQSLQFRELEFLVGLKDDQYFEYFKHQPEFLESLKKRMTSDDLRTTYLQLLEQEGLGSPAEAILKVYQTPAHHLPLYLLSESLVELDEYLILWREHHVHVVERIIGFKKGTGGSTGVQYLKKVADKKAFPELWDVRGMLVKT